MGARVLFFVLCICKRILFFVLYLVCLKIYKEKKKKKKKKKEYTGAPLGIIYRGGGANSKYIFVKLAAYPLIAIGAFSQRI